MRTILQHSADLVASLTLFHPALYQPQIRHLLHLVDGMLVCNGKKTLSNLYRQVGDQPDPKTAADFLWESPWEQEDVGRGRKQAMLAAFLGIVQNAAFGRDSGERG